MADVACGNPAELFTTTPTSDCLGARNHGLLPGTERACEPGHDVQDVQHHVRHNVRQNVRHYERHHVR